MTFLNLRLIEAGSLRPCDQRSNETPSIFNCMMPRCRAFVWSNSPLVQVWYSAGYGIGKVCPSCASRIGARANKRLRKVALRGELDLMSRRVRYEPGRRIERPEVLSSWVRDPVNFDPRGDK